MTYVKAGPALTLLFRTNWEAARVLSPHVKRIARRVIPPSLILLVWGRAPTVLAGKDALAVQRTQGGEMRLQSELFDRAADCERLMNRTSDQYKKLTLRLMRDLWIALANESPAMPARVLEEEVADLEQIQSGLDWQRRYKQKDRPVRGA